MTIYAYKNDVAFPQEEHLHQHVFEKLFERPKSTIIKNGWYEIIPNCPEHRWRPVGCYLQAPLLRFLVFQGSESERWLRSASASYHCLSLENRTCEVVSCIYNR